MSAVASHHTSTFGCWIWLGGIESDGGYSRFHSETLGVIAGHHWSLIAARGPLAKPVVRHRCDVRCSVRPDHLVDGTQAQNVADTARRGPVDELSPQRTASVAAARLRPAPGGTQR